MILASKPPRKTKRTRVPPPAEVVQLADIRCEQRLGGLLKRYYRKAA